MQENCPTQENFPGYENSHGSEKYCMSASTYTYMVVVTARVSGERIEYGSRPTPIRELQNSNRRKYLLERNLFYCTLLAPFQSHTTLRYRLVQNLGGMRWRTINISELCGRILLPEHSIISIPYNCLEQCEQTRVKSIDL